MNFGELTEEVLDATVRPDRERQAKRSINSVVRTMSLSGDHWRDLKEEILSERQDYVQQVGQAVKNLSLPDRFRKIAYIRRDVPDHAPGVGAVRGGQLSGGFQAGAEYNLIRPNQVKLEGRILNNTYYLSGANILLNQDVVDEVLFWGYYDYPVRLTAPSDENWITAFMPDLVIDWASQFLMATLGDKDRTQGFAALQNLQLSVFMDDALRDHEMNAGVGR